MRIFQIRHLQCIECGPIRVRNRVIDDVEIESRCYHCDRPLLNIGTLKKSETIKPMFTEQMIKSVTIPQALFSEADKQLSYMVRHLMGYGLLPSNTDPRFIESLKASGLYNERFKALPYEPDPMWDDEDDELP